MKHTTKNILIVTLGVLLGSALLSACHSPSHSKSHETEPTVQDSIVTEQSSNPEADRSGFCRITDSIPDAVIDLRYYGTHNFVGCNIDGYDKPVALLTCEATSALRQAANELRRKGYRLKIYDAYRPQCAVDHFLRWAQDPADTLMKAEFYPDIEKSAIFLRGFVARKSSHSRGSAVDLTIVYAATGEEVDMGGTFDFFGNISHADYESLTAEQHQNRVFLRDVMVRHGFKPARGEWWHFTLLNEPYPETYFEFRVR